MTDHWTGDALFNMALKLFVTVLCLPVCLAAHSETSNPEFECTVLERNKELQTNAIQRIHSLSLRSLATGGWIFSNQGNTRRLEQDAIVKKADVSQTSTIYEMVQNKLRIFLSGKSPSRIGLIWEIPNPPLEPKFLAKVTCH